MIRRFKVHTGSGTAFLLAEVPDDAGPLHSACVVHAIEIERKNGKFIIHFHTHPQQRVFRRLSKALFVPGRRMVFYDESSRYGGVIETVQKRSDERVCTVVLKPLHWLEVVG